jgi:hypothetical protein
VTPTLTATKSPMLLLIASPGMFSCLCHTLAGPNASPLKFLNGSTLPPLFTILYFSLGSSGLWSLLNALDSSLEETALMTIALESPELAV